MKRKLLLLIVFFISVVVKAQITYFEQDFESSGITNFRNTDGTGNFIETALVEGQSNCSYGAKANAETHSGGSFGINTAPNPSDFFAMNPEVPCGGYAEIFPQSEVFNLSGAANATYLSFRYLITDYGPYGSTMVNLKIKNDSQTFLEIDSDNHFITKNNWQFFEIEVPVIANLPDIYLSIYMVGGNFFGIDEILISSEPRFDRSSSTEIVDGLSYPYEMVLNGNDLYVAEAGANRVSKIDISEPTPTLKEVATGLSAVTGLLLNGNDLYMGVYNAGKISKVDISESTPVVTDVAIGFSGPAALILVGNELYVSETLSGKISKIDITASTATIINVVSGLNQPYGLSVDGNELYIAELDKISKIDITSPTPSPIDVLTNLDQPAGLMVDNGFLYFSEFNGQKVSNIDLSEATPSISELVSGLYGPTGMLKNGNDLYISEFSSGKIVKFNSGTLALNDKDLSNPLSIYPNPTKDGIINFKDSKTKNVEVYSILGNKVFVQDKVHSNIDLSTLNAGIYILKTHSSQGTSINKIIIE